MKKALWFYGLFLGLAIVATARFAPPKSQEALGIAARTADETWTIPGAGRTPGQNNTFFVSDLALTNLGSAAANVTITFVGPGGLPAKPVTLGAGATTVYRDVLNALWSANGLVGALAVHSDQPLVLRARTYNTAATGTFGVALPVYGSGSLLSAGEGADSIWVQQTPAPSSGFRTNVGVVFPDDGGGEAIVTFYDANGAAVGTLTYASESAGFQQLPVSSAAPNGLAIGRAQISVTRGSAAGYAVGVDNVTGDTSLYPFESLPGGVQDVVVSGVARLTGRNDTFFRTDARFYNPTSVDATVTVRFHASGHTNLNQPTTTLTIPAGRLIEAVDVLDSILHLPVGSGGAVRFTSDQPVAILARTSNVDPQGSRPGTFGAQQHPVPLASYLSSADAGAVVTAIRQDASFRTNVGFAAGVDGVTYNLTLRNSQGGAVAVTTGSLGAFGWAQPGIADLFPGTTIPADATLLVQVTSGSVDVYDASLDNASGDLVVTPVAAVPVAIPSSASIGPAGGSIRSADGRLTVKVPANALPNATALSISSIQNGAPQGIGSAYALQPVGVHFETPAQIVLNYGKNDLVGTDASALGIAVQDGSNWLAILGGSLDPLARTVIVPVSSTSPGPTSAAGRGTQSAAATGNLAPYGSVRLEPKSAIVPVRGHVRLALTFVGPSSMATRSRLFFVLGGTFAQNVHSSWYVNGVPLGNAIEGTVFGTPAHDAVYTAPNCKPPINPVYIGASVEVIGGLLGPASTVVGARVRVIERDWQVEAIYESRSQCLLGAAWSLEYTRGHNGTFSLDDDGRVIDYLAGLNHTQTTNPAWCPGFGNECQQVALAAPIGDLLLRDVTGRLVSALAGPAFDLTTSVEIPGTGAKIVITCPEGVAMEPVTHGAPPEAVQPFLVPYRTPPLESRFTIAHPGTTETARLILKPIPQTGCP